MYSNEFSCEDFSDYTPCDQNYNCSSDKYHCNDTFSITTWPPGRCQQSCCETEKCNPGCKKLSVDIICNNNCSHQIEVEGNLVVNGSLTVQHCPIQTNRLAALSITDTIHVCSKINFKKDVSIEEDFSVTGNTELGPTSISELSICPGMLRVASLAGCTGSSGITLTTSIIGGTALFTDYNLINQNLGTGLTILGGQTGPGGSVRDFRTLTTPAQCNVLLTNTPQSIGFDYSLSPYYISLQSNTSQDIPNNTWTLLTLGTLAGGGNSFIYPGQLTNNMSFATNFNQPIHLEIMSSVFFSSNDVGFRSVRIGVAPATDPNNVNFIHSNSMPAQVGQGTLIQTNFTEELLVNSVFVISVYQNSGAALSIETGANYRTNTIFKAYYQGTIN